MWFLVASGLCILTGTMIVLLSSPGIPIVVVRIYDVTSHVSSSSSAAAADASNMLPMPAAPPPSIPSLLRTKRSLLPSQLFEDFVRF